MYCLEMFTIMNSSRSEILAKCQLLEMKIQTCFFIRPDESKTSIQGKNNKKF